MQLSATGIERLALAGDVLAAAGGETVSLHDLGGSPSGEVALPWPAHELALSPSGRLLAAAPRPPRKELVLHDRATGESRRVPNTGDAWLSGFAATASPRFSFMPAVVAPWPRSRRLASAHAIACDPRRVR